VQRFGEGLSRGPEVKTLSRRVVVGAEERGEAFGLQGGEIGLSRNEAAHSADGVLDATFLPGRVGIAEEGLDGEPVECAMTSELGAIVKGDGLAQLWRQAGEQPHKMPSDAAGGLAGRPGGEQQPGLALVDREHRLAVFGEQHQVGFPVAWGLAIGGVGRPFGHRNTAFDEACGASAASAAEPPLALPARQVVAPAVVLLAGDLGVDEAVDALVANHVVAGFAGQSAGDLLGGPAAGQTIEDSTAQGGLAFEARPRPAPRPGLFLSVTWFVADVAAGVAPQLPRNRRWRAIQSCRDLPDRAAIGAKAGNLHSVVQ
jgi:hypothetical protein